MLEFLDHALKMPTVIPLGMMILVICFFLVSSIIGVNKDLHADGDLHVHTDACMDVDGNLVDNDLGDGQIDSVDSKGFLNFIGIKSGVHTMALLAFSSFLLFASVFFISEYIDLETTGFRKLLGILLVFGLLPISNNIVYVLLKPISNIINSSAVPPESTLGKKGIVKTLAVDKGFVFIQVEGWTEEQLVYLNKEDLDVVKVDDMVEITSKEINKNSDQIFVGQILK